MARYATLTWLSVFALVLAGCGPSENYKYQLTLIPKGLTHEHWQSVHRGAERAALDLKDQQNLAVKIIWDGPSRENEPQAQINIIKNAVGRRVNGIILAPQDSKTMVDPVQQAVEKGIPVVIIDSGLNKPELMVKYVATDNYRGGRLAAERLLEVLQQDKDRPQPYRLVLFRYQKGSESTEQRETGFLDFVNEQVMQNKVQVKWVSTDFELGATKDTAKSNALSFLNPRRDEIDGIFAPNESATDGVVQALRGLDRHQKVRLVGFDASEPVLEALRKGDVNGLILQDPYKMGYLSVWLLVQHLEGKNVNPDGNKILSTGEIVVTRETVDTPDVRGLFDQVEQSRRKISPPALSQ